VAELTLREEILDEPGGQAMIAGFEADIAARYPGWTPGSGPGLTPADVLPPDGRLVVAYLGSDAAGCGAFKRLDERHVEVKRVFVAPEARGRGVARAIVGRLEELAHDAGYAVVRLDVGDNQPEAFALYQSLGYTEIPDYNNNPWASFWFEKPLD
jgi:GNAT superfamily N-acetyltransferase